MTILLATIAALGLFACLAGMVQSTRLPRARVRLSS